MNNPAPAARPSPCAASTRPASRRGLPLPALAVVLAVASWFAACRPSSPDSSLPPSTSPPRAYAVTGVVHRIHPDGLTAIIDHELIPGYMMAMIMPFQARDPRTLATVYPGEQITFRLLVTTNDAWIDQVKKTGQTRPVPAADALQLVDELEVGDPLPDCTLTNDHGTVFQLSDLRGQAFALTFIFTRCPLPTYCPLMSRNFALAGQELLQSNTPSNWHLVTVSFDPDFDSPRVLDFYARQYRTDSNRWTFASGDRDAIEQLGRSLGLMLFREETTISHNLRTVVVDPAGRIHHVFRDNLWQPEELASQLRDAAGCKQPSDAVTAVTCQLAVTGMACDACALTIQSALRSEAGVLAAHVDFTNRVANVTYDPAQLSPSSLIRKVEELTYGATLINP